MKAPHRPRPRPGVARTMSERARSPETGAAAIDPTGLLDRLRDALGQFSTLAVASGTHDVDIGGRPGRLVFGVSVRGLQDEQGMRAETFGHVPRPGASHNAAAPREPLVDVFVEQSGIVVVAELPGVAPEDVTCRVDGAELVIDATGAVRFHRRVPLPEPVEPGSLRVTCRNGMFEALLDRAAKDAP